MTEKQTIIAYAATLVSLVFIFFVSLSLEGKDRDLLLEEGGIIETASACGYLFCLIYILKKGTYYYVRRYHYFVLLIVFFGLRELDFDKRFTTMGILKTKFYLSQEVPVFEKVFGIIVISLLLYAIFCIIYRHSRTFFTGIKNGSAIAIGSLLTVVNVVISKILDGISRKLDAVDVHIEQQIAMHLEAVEEILELGIPIILILTFIAHFTALASNNPNN